MKKSIAVLLAVIMVVMCIFTLAACQNGVDGKDGIDGANGKDGINGTNGTDGKDGADGNDGEDGKSAFEIFKEHNPDYVGDEQQWLDDIADGKLANNKYYDIITYGKNIYAAVTSGTAASGTAAMTLTNCIAQLDNNVILPVCNGAEWQIKLSGILVNKDNTGTQLLTSASSVAVGSSISYGAHNNGVSFAEQIRDITGSKMVKETVSGTTLSNQLGNSYADRFSRFKFDDNPDFLILQLSTNDFTRGEITLGSVGTQTEGFVPNTTASAIEYIITETKKKSPRTQIVIYSCVVNQGWANSHPQYSVFANTELAKLQAKYGITVVGLFGQTQLFGGIMGDDIHPNGAGYAAMFTPNMINVLTDYSAAK